MSKELDNFLAIEGVDAVGKTTTVSLMSERGFVSLKTPNPKIAKYRYIFEHTDLRLRFLYYLFGVFLTGKEAISLGHDRQKVTDRYLLTTIASHEARGLDKTWIETFEHIFKFIAKPTCTFVLNCEEEERLRRLFARGANKVDIKNIQINPKIFAGLFKWADKLGYRIALIETSNISPEEVANLVISKCYQP